MMMGVTLLALASRVTLGTIMLFTGVSKAQHLSAFTEGAIAYDLLPLSVMRPFVLILTVLEIALGLAFLSGTMVQWSAIVTLILLTSFVLAAAVNMARGRAIPCHCFGPSEQDVIGPATVIRQGLLILLSAVVALSSPNVSLTILLRDGMELELVTVISISIFLTLLVIAIGPIEILMKEILMQRHRNIRLLDDPDYTIH